MAAPTQLYAIQSAAYDSHAQYNLKKTDSTPTTPPSITPTNAEEACKKKKEIVFALPTKCGHCSHPVDADDRCFAEVKGTVMVYCKKKGGCGRSQVLFVCPDLTIPKYKQVCIWEEDKSTSTANDQHKAIAQLHGLPYTSSDSKCIKCSKSYKEHTFGYDQNGWVEYARDVIHVPQDWPLWNSSTGLWS